jgi:hypothetical protein
LQAEKQELCYDTLRRLVNQRLALLGETSQRANAARPVSPPPPSPRELSFAVLIKAHKRSEIQRGQLERLRASDARLAEAVGLLEGFAALVRKHAGASLGQWQEAVARSNCAEMRRFADGLKQDKAVEAALQQPWSNGQVEGQVNRLKLIKRQMYGRAGFELLRRRVLHRAEARGARRGLVYIAPGIIISSSRSKTRAASLSRVGDRSVPSDSLLLHPDSPTRRENHFSIGKHTG